MVLSRRPLKRPVEVVESPQDRLGPASVKLPRLEKGPEGFSQVVNTKLQSNSRTGQACDRCKVRKLRCDTDPKSCSHCARLNLQCYVTNRSTGRTECRDYLQQLEHQNEKMMIRLQDMEKLLEGRGIQVRPWQWTPLDESGSLLSDNSDPSKDKWTPFFSLWVKDTSCQTQISGSPVQTGHVRIAVARLGSTAQGTPLCDTSITQLPIGMATDITSLNAPNVDNLLPYIHDNALLDGPSLQFSVPSPSKTQPTNNAVWYASTAQH